MKAIMAMSKNRCIGKDSKIPWHYSDDFKWFKEFTMGKTLIVGRKTFDDLPPLKGRSICVLTTDAYRALHSLTEPNKKADNVYYRRPIKEGWLTDVFEPSDWQDSIVAGGKKTYEFLMPHITEFYVTHIDQDYEGDTFMPPFEGLFKNKEVVKEFEFGKVIKYSDRYGKKCCNEWNINIPRIHSGLEMAAANGNPTHLTQQMKYCPYCGVKLDSLPYMTLEDLKHDEELAKKFGITL